MPACQMPSKAAKLLGLNTSRVERLHAEAEGIRRRLRNSHDGEENMFDSREAGRGGGAGGREAGCSTQDLADLWHQLAAAKRLSHFTRSMLQPAGATQHAGEKGNGAAAGDSLVSAALEVLDDTVADVEANLNGFKVPLSECEACCSLAARPMEYPPAFGKFLELLGPDAADVRELDVDDDVTFRRIEKCMEALLVREDEGSSGEWLGRVGLQRCCVVEWQSWGVLNRGERWSWLQVDMPAPLSDLTFGGGGEQRERGIFRRNYYEVRFAS